jgi:hypothetical protein
MNKQTNKEKFEYEKRLQEAYANANRKLEDGSLKDYEITNYVRGYMKESSKY